MGWLAVRAKVGGWGAALGLGDKEPWLLKSLGGGGAATPAGPEGLYDAGFFPLRTSGPQVFIKVLETLKH